MDIKQQKHITQLGLSIGKPLPLVGLGCNLGKHRSITYEDAQKFFETAIDTGYRHFDVALLYNTEVPLGRAINAKIKTGVIKRADVYVTTKLCWDCHHQDDVKESFQQSLQNLGLEYVDLYLIHWPAPVKKDADASTLSRPFDEEKDNIKLPVDLLSKPLDEENDYVTVWKILEHMVKEGKARALGLSNFNSRQVETVLQTCTIKPVVNECEVHLYHQNKELIEHNTARGVTVVAFTPLGTGYSGQESPQKNPVVLHLAQKYKKSPVQIALRFLVQQGIPVIPSSSSPQHQADNLDLFDFEIEEEDLQKLRSINKNERTFKMPQLSNHKEYPFHEPF